MRNAVVLFFAIFCASCKPEWGASSVNEELDGRVLEGCYRASGAPEILLKDGIIKSNGIKIFDNYKFVKVGLKNEEVIIVRPKMALYEDVKNGKIEFVNIGNKTSDDMNYKVYTDKKNYTIEMFSFPNYKIYQYNKYDCMQ